MIFKVLGAGSATPVVGRYPSAFALILESETFLIDCGEGTQWRMLEFGIKHQKINHIFISHLHGDHFLGLVGLISTMNSLARKNELTVHGPAGLKEIITTQFRIQDTRLDFDLFIKEIESESISLLTETKVIEIFTFPLAHRIATYGFLFKEKTKLRNLIKEKMPKNMSLAHVHMLKKGEDVLDENGDLIYSADELTISNAEAKSFAYCSDTAYSEAIIPSIYYVDLLYHEATFLEEKKLRASETFHSTAKQAASIALQSKVKKLVIGHFSARYKEIEPFYTEASEIFPNTVLATSGLELTV